MLDSSILRYCLYGSCVVLSSELLYHSYFWLKNWRKVRSSPEEVHEVIWTNELTQSCTAQHRFSRSNSGGIEATSPTSRSPSSNEFLSRSPNRHSVKLATPIKANRNPCSNPFCTVYNIGRLIEFIDSAHYSIDLAMYTFTSYEVSQAFGRAFQRGVFIRIISDKEMAYSTGSQIIPLTKTDSKKTEWTAALTLYLLDLWEENIDGLRGVRKNTHIYKEMGEKLGVTGAEIKNKVDSLTKRYKKEQALVGPSGGAPSTWEHFERLNKILATSKAINYKRVMVESTGVPVRCNRNTNDLMHHKFCIIDEPTRVAAVHKKQNKTPANNNLRSLLMTGSLNWTNQGFGYNWENILITSNPEYLNKYSQEFERLWKVFDNVVE